MTNTELLALAKETKEKAGKATEGPYFVECVHHDRGDISYEVAAKGQSFHVSFYERLHMDERITAKNQAHFYAHSRTAAPILAEAVERLVEENEKLKAAAKNFIHRYDAEFADETQNAPETLGKIDWAMDEFRPLVFGAEKIE